MSTVTISDKQWLKIVRFLRSCPGLYVAEEAKCRRSMEGVLWIARSGAQWRLLPETYGTWNSIFKRFARWCDNGIWDRMHQHLADEPNMEYLIVDSTVIRPTLVLLGPRRTVTKRHRRWAAVDLGSAPRLTSTWMLCAIRCVSS